MWGESKKVGWGRGLTPSAPSWGLESDVFLGVEVEDANRIL